MRHRKTDAHIATIRVSVPIDPMNVATISRASAAISGMLGHGIFPPGTTIEVLNSRFGRVDVSVTPKQVLDLLTPREPSQTAGDPRGMMPQTMSLPGGIAEAMQEIAQQVSAGDGMDPPESLRRVPRPAPNGGG